jgi:hypothetical protein
MMRGIDDVIADLEAFRPSATEPDSLQRLNTILEGLEEMPDNLRAAHSLFRLLERHSGAELGSPGPIVHSLETIAPRSRLLAESLMRKPTTYTIWMVGRILNSKQSQLERDFWLLQLKNVQSHPHSSPHDRDRAGEILVRHAA